MVGRVSWAAYSGEDIEATVAMMLNREHPNSVNINPSRGDGGVDILDRAALPDGDVVYQVKKYADPLTPGRQKKIESSLARLLDPERRDRRWSDLKIAQWRLVMPWNPTPEAEHWLQNLGSRYGVPVVWDGLTAINQLAAKYSDVIDFYLHGGKSEILQAQSEMVALMSLEKLGDTGLEVEQVVERVDRALKVLDGDPHYLYEFHFGQGEPPAPVRRPMLVTTTYTVDEKASRWYKIDLIARCAMSVEARPVTITGTITVASNTEAAFDIQDFLDFGTPFTSPPGAYNGVIDAPGGLGGELTNATVWAGPPADDDLGENPDIRLRIADATGAALSEVFTTRTERSQGNKGVRSVLTEINGIFNIEHRFNLADATTTQNLRLNYPFGKPVLTVLTGLEFLVNYRPPNRLYVGPRQLPPARDKAHDIPPYPPEAEGNFDQLLLVLRALNRLQEHTDSVITLPDPRHWPSQYPSWQTAADLLDGEEVKMAAEGDDIGFHLILPALVTVPEQTFSVAQPLQIWIGEQLIEFGTMHATLTDPVLVRSEPAAPDQMHWVFTTPDRTISYRLASSAEDATDQPDEATTAPEQ